MRRYRFGPLAASVAALYLVAIAVLTVIALVTGEEDALWRVVTGEPATHGLTAVWWVVLALALIGAVQGAACWQVLRGRLRGTPVDGGRQVAWLRGTLYVTVALALLPSWSWPMSLLSALTQVVIVWLFFRVLAGAIPTWARILMLGTGTIDAVAGLALTLSYTLELEAPIRILSMIMLDGLLRMAWVVPILVAQARDPRWTRTTVWMGVLSLVTTLLQPSSFVTFSYGEVSYTLVAFALLGALSVFGLVWAARSAHELTGPRPLPAEPPPGRAPPRWWPLPALAIALPLIPAAVNLANGMPFWIGPRGPIQTYVLDLADDTTALFWLALDLLVGVGAPALLVLAAVLRRTQRLIRATTLTLVLLAAIGALPTESPRDYGFPLDDLPLYPDHLFVTDPQGVPSFGLSPLWYSAALLAAALLLLLLYAAPPARRMRHHVLVGVLTSSAVLAFLPVADQPHGPVTTAQDCLPPEPWGRAEHRAPTGEEAYICGVRGGGTPLKFAATTPDQVLLAHGRRLCGIYTRDDPRETARMRTLEGLDRQALASTLAGVCPSVAATLKAERDEQDAELKEWQADSQRICDSTPRHHPLIKPAKQTVIKESQRTDHGVLEAWEPTGNADDTDDPLVKAQALLAEAQAPGNGLVAAFPGQLMILSNPDFDLCVTLETYPRRPPVETKGWDHVMEVGYDSSLGEIVLSDALSGTELPDLSLNDRKGHYRIRVHYDWFPWDGLHEGGQRLLIMAYPGRGDNVTTYRRPTAR
ncbi:hypothetical protein LDL08_30565 [Nonomuraea glycinis]|uniref:Uncharacterized protein n=1 Tax=Nonomuraea glycinis TaxID=2047744 RepID=A0A918AFG9_9ACTN|nr:hypothetical protein [Nonomuraea glycinis]MCA2180531.1 hypothetical protein [Nonomuraea glycinis]GGP18701.1 hypothetical protein GCM10012278_91760 [Nonomuraea glycinis]